jgi:hypothetical protein
MGGASRELIRETTTLYRCVVVVAEVVEVRG